jgi:hypothetical protein
MTTPLEPGERRPGQGRTTLERPPGDRYLPTRRPAKGPGVFERVRAPLAVAVGGVLAFVVLGGILAITAGLVILAGLIGWLVGLLVRPPVRAAVVAIGVVVAGLLGIWLFGRWEGGVLDPIEYLAEVQGFVVPLELLAAGGLAAAASR